LSQTKSRYFIALLPPQPIQDEVNQIKQYFADRYDSCAAQKSPPHITLQPPFEWERESVSVVQECLQQFAGDRSSVPISLSGFAAFIPRVIYVNVLQTPELLSLQKELMAEMETSLAIRDSVSGQRSFVPHMTVAFRDLTQQNFRVAWPEFEARSFQYNFIATHLTLLIHDGKQWQISSEFALKDQSFSLES
jgi:2'-5' RNA ligase